MSAPARDLQARIQYRDGADSGAHRLAFGIEAVEHDDRGIGTDDPRQWPHLAALGDEEIAADSAIAGGADPHHAEAISNGLDDRAAPPRCDAIGHTHAVGTTRTAADAAPAPAEAITSGLDDRAATRRCDSLGDRPVVGTQGIEVDAEAARTGCDAK